MESVWVVACLWSRLWFWVWRRDLALLSRLIALARSAPDDRSFKPDRLPEEPGPFSLFFLCCWSFSMRPGRRFGVLGRFLWTSIPPDLCWRPPSVSGWRSH